VSWLPGYFTRAGEQVGHSRECEQQIGEPVQVYDHDLRNLYIPLEADHPTFGAPADRTCDVEHRALLAAAGNDEGLERLEVPIAVVDGVLELTNAPVVDIRLLEVSVHFVEIRRREQRADAKKIALHRNQDLIDPWKRLDGARHSDHGVELVDVAVSFDTGIVLGNSSAAEESGVAGIARFRVDLHRHQIYAVRSARITALLGMPNTNDRAPGDEDLDDEFPLGDGTAETTASVYCPYCNETVEIAIDPGSGPTQEYVEDCEICCQPWLVNLHYNGDGTAQVNLAPLDQ